MKKFMKILLPIGIVIGALAVVAVLFLSRPKAERHAIVIKEPLVTVTEVNPQNLRIPVFTRGTVTPGTEIPMVSEVSGPVTYVSENFARGGFFKKGEVLIKVDPIEYEVTLKKANATVAQALQLLEQATAERRVRSAVKGVTNELGRFQYQYDQAKAQYDAARAELEAINLQKKKTTMYAPFDGRVRLGNVNPGQYLRPGIQLGLIYAVNSAEVRLPLSDNQLALVNIPYRFSEGTEGPSVTLTGDYGGRKFHWKGQVVRSESGVDEFNRLLYVIAEIPDPYAIDPKQPDRPPLTAGNFVEATIEGRYFDQLYVVPRRALRSGSVVWSVDSDSRLKRHNVDILYKGKDVIYVKSGLQAGDHVVLSQLDVAVDGMKVRASTVPNPGAGEGGEGNLLDTGNSGAMFQPKPDEVSERRPTEQETKPNAKQPLGAEALQQGVAKAKEAWDNASLLEKKAALDKAKQTIELLNQANLKPAPAPAPAPAKPAATTQPAAIPQPTATTQPAAPAGRAMSPLADLISSTEAQLNAGQPTSGSANSAPSTVAHPEHAPAGQPQAKPIVIAPVSTPGAMSEALQ
ncbi:HlyD family secretion protein [gamma proteobacterium HdN1]|nr:HlyD family secretion protein [gamma proteobacterium HdN1]